jgi:DNA-binding transcriptional ArsR family regulator
VPARSSAPSSPTPATTATDEVTERDDNLAKALAHPLRQRILEALNQGIDSPREIAEEIGAKLGDVGYHTRKLHELGVIELVRTEQRRGAIKHFYRPTERAMLTDRQWARLPVSVRRRLFGQNLDQIWSHVRHAIKRKGFDRDDAHVSWTTFELDDAGYEAMTKLAMRTVDEALEIQADVINRRARGEDADVTKTELVVLHFLPNGEPRRP